MAPKPEPDHTGDQPPRGTGQRLRAWLFGPIGLTLLVVIIFIALMGYGFIILVNAGLKASQDTGTTACNSTNMPMNPTMNPGNVPNATQKYGAQPVPYTVAADGTKVFYFTAGQVMWEPVHGYPRVLA